MKQKRIVVITKRSRISLLRTQHWLNLALCFSSLFPLWEGFDWWEKEMGRINEEAPQQTVVAFFVSHWPSLKRFFFWSFLFSLSCICFSGNWFLLLSETKIRCLTLLRSLRTHKDKNLCNATVHVSLWEVSSLFFINRRCILGGGILWGNLERRVAETGWSN